MTIIEPHRLTCPLCGKPFDSMVITSTNTFGRLHSDLYREAGGAQPVCIFVHTCPLCGYSGFEGDFEPQAFSQAFRDLLAQTITPEIKSRKIDPNGNYYLAALCAEWRGAPPHVLARIYHMGAWCCRVRGEKEKERFYLGKAAGFFEMAVLDTGAPKDNAATFTYLLGDIYRRLGDAEKAREWYGKVERAIKENGGDPKILEFARRQLREPADYFT